VSYLADPVANPIDIDAGITYTYVIPQQGATEISVDDLDDFDLLATLGSPALLTVNFTGTATALPQYFTATIRLFTVEGTESTQDLTFRVLPDDATQRVPNITTKNVLGVGEGQRVDLKLTSDIDATLSASGLTAGLAVGSSDHLVGTAPSTSGFNVFTLSATNGDYVYYRYFVLIVGTGTTPVSQNFFAFPPGLIP
jgi:hypothetical protein